MGGSMCRKATNATEPKEYLAAAETEQKEFLEQVEMCDARGAFRLFKDAARAIKSTRECTLAAVRKDGYALQFAADPLRADKEIALAAVAEEGYQVIKFAAPKLREDRDLWITALQRRGDALLFAASALKADKKAVLTAVANYGDALQFAAEPLRADKEVVLMAVSNHGNALQSAADALQADEEVVLAALANSGDAWKYSSPSCPLWADKEFVLAKVQANAETLNFVNKTAPMWADKDFVLRMVQLRGDALRYADKSANFWKEKEAVLSLVQSTGRALEFASDDIRADKEVVLVAVRTTPTSLKFVERGLNQDPDCLKESGLWDNEQSTFGRTEKAILSVRFTMAKTSTDYATNFALFLKRNGYLREFQTYIPKFIWRKSSCDPQFTNILHPCRGTSSTCQFSESQNLFAETPGAEKRPSKSSCWRYTFRYHLEESKATNGFMIQVQERHDLGEAQKIEAEMAKEAGVKTFRTLTTSEDVSTGLIQELEEAIKRWYDDGCKNFELEEVGRRC